MNRFAPLYPLLRFAARAMAVVLAFAFSLAVSAFVYFLIALYDIGRILEAWFFFFLALDLALLLRLVAWAVRSHRLARVAVVTALFSLAVFPVWAAWNWAIFLRYPDIPSERVLFWHSKYWNVDADGDAILVSPRLSSLCPCDGMTFRPPRCAPITDALPPEARFVGEPPRVAATAWVIPVVTKALAALSETGHAPQRSIRATWRGVADLFPTSAAGASEPIEAVLVWTPSEKDLAHAETKGVELARIPIAWDPLVFHVPVASPVRDLTSGRLSDIYHGRVRSWRELGFGDRHDIIPYEREYHEDAQRLARSWLAPEPVTSTRMGNPPLKWWTDEDAMDGHLAEFRAKPGAIGYSMHVMAAPLEREGIIRLLSVDGVAPTADAIAAGRYPPGRTLELIAVGPPSDNVRKLAAFLLSPAGRNLLTSAGFIPISSSASPLPHD